MTPKIIRISEGTTKIIAAVGPTGSGKSTLISLLNGAPLKFKKVGGGKWQISHDDTTGKYPIIGHDNKSCTTVPDFYPYKGKTFIDLAGWFDTRKPTQ